MIIKDTEDFYKGQTLYKGQMAKQDQQSDKDRGLQKSFSDGKHLQGLFDYNSSFIYAYKKTERLITAVYMVTDNLSDTDPLKKNVRESSLGLLTAILLLKDEPSSLKVFKGINESVLYTVSLLDIAFSTGKITEMNASVLKREFFNLLESVRPAKDVQGASLNSSFFEVEMPREDTVSQSKNYSDERSQYGSQFTASSSSIYSKEEAGKSAPKKTPARSSGYVGNVAKNERRAAIFNLLREKKEITVRDLANVVTDCSEKTLQRELLQLVDEGILHKEGERRWSRYSLVV
ncbi:MAG: hypothetical protein ACQESA_03085 [Patescibacteria group bacterium]